MMSVTNAPLALPSRYREMQEEARQFYGHHYGAALIAVLIQLEARMATDCLDIIDAGTALMRESRVQAEQLMIAAAMVEKIDRQCVPVTDEMIVGGADALTGILDAMGITLSPAEAEIHAKGVLVAAMAGRAGPLPPLGAEIRESVDGGEEA